MNPKTPPHHQLLPFTGNSLLPPDKGGRWAPFKLVSFPVGWLQNRDFSSCKIPVPYLLASICTKKRALDSNRYQVVSWITAKLREGSEVSEITAVQEITSIPAPMGPQGHTWKHSTCQRTEKSWGGESSVLGMWHWLTGPGALRATKDLDLPVEQTQRAESAAAAARPGPCREGSGAQVTSLLQPCR